MGIEKNRREFRTLYWIREVFLLTSEFFVVPSSKLFVVEHVFVEGMRLRLGCGCRRQHGETGQFTALSTLGQCCRPPQ